MAGDVPRPKNPFDFRSWWREWRFAVAGALIASAFGYFYVARFPLERQWAQERMSAAVNYACTGNFGPLHLAPGATPEDRAALRAVDGFLNSHPLDFSCASFPRHVAGTSFFDGIEAANTEQPMYLMLLYGVLWRLLGLHWWVTYYVLAGVFALSFLAMYLSLRPFSNAIAASAISLVFLSSPLFVASILTPRDALKFPFAVAIVAGLVGFVSVPRATGRFLGFAFLIGLLIGVGFGFRTDLLMFLGPAAFVVAALGQIAHGADDARKLRTGLLTRASGAGAVALAFCIGAWMPLLNDHYLRKPYADTSFHPMAIGLLGITNHDLFQSHDPVGGMYLFRNEYSTDPAVGVRIMEYAERRDGQKLPFAQGAYWGYAKDFYLDVTKRIPADILSGAIGAFINLMTLPVNLSDRQSLAAIASNAAWSGAYPFARDSIASRVLLRPLDHVFKARPWVLVAFFFLNLLCTFAFLCILARKLGARAAVAAVVLVGAALFVVSLRFEMRHMFYVYAFPVVAWTSVLAYFFRDPPADARAFFERCKPLVPAALPVGILLLGIAVTAYATLLAARAYQVNTLRPVIEDWSRRKSVPMEFDTSSVGRGKSLVRIRSALPLSTGGTRAAGAPVDALQMGVVVAEFDGKRCANRLVSVTGVGAGQPSADTHFAIRETFALEFKDAQDYVAYLPAFFYRFSDGSGNFATMTFAGLEISDEDVKCLRGVRAVTEFRKSDVLLDFFIPGNPEVLRDDDLFQRVKIPGVGLL